MEIITAAFLGIVQGLTEYLPISSSGHLILVPTLLNIDGLLNSLTFDVALHVGTAIAVIWFFWKDWIRLVKAFLKNVGSKNLVNQEDSKLLLLLLVGSIPAAIIGLVFNDFIERSVRQPLLVAGTLFVFALILFWADRVGSQKKNLSGVNWQQAIFIGLAQAISLVPGVSRSGITISAGMFSGLNREAATRFSFLLSAPAIAGAAALSLKNFLEETHSNGNLSIFAVGTIAAAVSGWLTIKFLLGFVSKNNFNIFVWYRIILAIIVIILYF